jgi:hypothetical protein
LNADLTLIIKSLNLHNHHYRFYERFLANNFVANSHKFDQMACLCVVCLWLSLIKRYFYFHNHLDSDLDIRVPSIGLLSEDSTDITTLKNNINNLNDYNKTHVQLIVIV